MWKKNQIFDYMIYHICIPFKKCDFSIKKNSEKTTGNFKLCLIEHDKLRSYFIINFVYK